MAAIAGGVKGRTRIPVIEPMPEKVGKPAVGGRRVFTFLGG